MASCPLVLRELPRGPVPYVAPSLCVLQNFPLPCVVFCKELLSRGKHRVPFFFSGLVAMLGVLSSLSQVLPRSTTLARACPEGWGFSLQLSFLRGELSNGASQKLGEFLGAEQHIPACPSQHSCPNHAGPSLAEPVFPGCFLPLGGKRRWRRKG